MFDPNQYPNHLGAGGGFGPVSTPEGEWLAALGPWSFSLRGADMGTSAPYLERTHVPVKQ